jgi:hypothetical protein
MSTKELKLKLDIHSLDPEEPYFLKGDPLSTGGWFLGKRDSYEKFEGLIFDKLVGGGKFYENIPPTIVYIRTGFDDVEKNWEKVRNSWKSCTADVCNVSVYAYFENVEKVELIITDKRNPRGELCPKTVQGYWWFPLSVKGEPASNTNWERLRKSRVHAVKKFIEFKYPHPHKHCYNWGNLDIVLTRNEEPLNDLSKKATKEPYGYMSGSLQSHQLELTIRNKPKTTAGASATSVPLPKPMVTSSGAGESITTSAPAEAGSGTGGGIPVYKWDEYTGKKLKPIGHVETQVLYGSVLYESLRARPYTDTEVNSIGLVDKSKDDNIKLTPWVLSPSDEYDLSQFGAIVVGIRRIRAFLVPTVSPAVEPSEHESTGGVTESKSSEPPLPKQFSESQLKDYVHFGDVLMTGPTIESTDPAFNTFTSGASAEFYRREATETYKQFNSGTLRPNDVMLVLSASIKVQIESGGILGDSPTFYFPVNSPRETIVKAVEFYYAKKGHTVAKILYDGHEIPNYTAAPSTTHHENLLRLKLTTQVI